MTRRETPPDIGAAIAALEARYPASVTTGKSARRLHASDESHHEGHEPDIVVHPRTTEEVAGIVRIAARNRVPITPFGAGSGLEGGAIPQFGGISLDTSELSEIFEIRADDMAARVGAGVRRLDLNRALRDTGLFFPVDPGANASIGGMASTGASGTNAVRYGVMRENVLGLTVVTADGNIVKTGSLARKSSSGYDLTRLFVGSEGTLGIVTDVTLRLHPIPDAVSAHAGFETLAGAVDAVTDIKRAGLAIGRVELLDASLVEVINRRGAMRLAPLPTLSSNSTALRPKLPPSPGPFPRSSRKTAAAGFSGRDLASKRQPFGKPAAIVFPWRRQSDPARSPGRAMSAYRSQGSPK